MRTTKFLAGGLLTLVLASGAWLPAAGGEKEERQAKHHHDLRGVISKVEAKKNQFEIETDAGRVVLCLIDGETTIKRGSETIELKDVVAGDRALCHCAALRNGRHYSTSLRVEKNDEAED